MKNKMFKLLSLTLALSLLLVACGKKKGEELEKEDYIPVEVIDIKKQSLNNPRSFKGKVVANEEVSIIPKVMGTVETVNVKLGDRVSKGQVLFTVDASNIQRNLDQANVSIDLASKSVAQAESVLNTARVNRNTTEESMLKAKLDLERSEELYKEGAIPKAQLEQAKLGFLSSDSQLKTVDSQIVQAEIGLEQAKDQLNQANISKNQILDTYNDTVVKSPLGGVVSTLDVKVGQIASNAQPAAVVVDNSKVYIELEVIESVVNKLKLGQSVKAKIPAAFNKEVSSTIEYISPTADIANKLYTVKVAIANPDNKVRPGMTGEVNLSTDEINNVIAVTRDVILNNNGEDYVFVVKDNRAVKKVVKLGRDYDDYVEIKSGLNVGDKLIVKGHNYVDDKKKVKVMGDK